MTDKITLSNQSLAPITFGILSKHTLPGSKCDLICSLLGDQKKRKREWLVQTVLHCAACERRMLERCAAQAVEETGLSNIGFLRTTKSGPAEMTCEDEGHFHLMASRCPDAVMVIFDFSTDCAGTIRSWHIKDPGALEEVELQKLTRKSPGVNFEVHDLEKENKSMQHSVSSMLRDILVQKVSTIDSKADNLTVDRTETELGT